VLLQMQGGEDPSRLASPGVAAVPAPGEPVPR
jgi:hypothetical protein